MPIKFRADAYQQNGFSLGHVSSVTKRCALYDLRNLCNFEEVSYSIHF